MHLGSTNWALPIHATFSDLDCIWLYFKVTALSNCFNWKYSVHIQLSWNCVWLLIMSSRSWIYNHFWFLQVFKGDSWHISLFEKNFRVGFFSDAIETSSFKFCVIISLLGVYIVVIGLMTLTLFQGHRCVQNINCQLCGFWFLSSLCDCCVFKRQNYHNFCSFALECWVVWVFAVLVAYCV